MNQEISKNFPKYNTDVLIVGGSIVGLSAALFLAWRNVNVIVVEKHESSSKHPRAIGFTELSLEHYRAAGIIDKIPQVNSNSRLRRAKVESLTGNWHAEIPWTPHEQENDKGILSPVTGAAIAQDLLEPIIRQSAKDFGANLHLGTELIELIENGEGILARVKNRKKNEIYEISAKYVIAADGANSSIREQLGIKRKGVGHLRFIRSVLFYCTEAEFYLEKGIQQFEIDQTEFKAFLTHYPDGRWVLMFNADHEYSESDLKSYILQALGRKMNIDIITTGTWEMAGQIAEKYQKGHIFLVGDAAHQLPPTRGGFGANTGIDDVYNLAWKLQMVLQNKNVGKELLETYHLERYPIGWLRHQQTFSRPDYLQWVDTSFKAETLLSSEAMEFGQRVNSTAVLNNDTCANLPLAAHPNIWLGHTGTRVPHAWVSRYEERISTIDLFTKSFVTISKDISWLDIAKRISKELGIDIEVLHVGIDIHFLDDKIFEELFDISKDDCILVRPDAIVAWRSTKQCGNKYNCFKEAFKKVTSYK